MNLIETFRHHSEVLAAESRSLESIEHAGNRGVERKGLLEGFLEKVLPERFALGRGEIRATNGWCSRQEDLIVYDRLNCPRLFVGKQSQVFPVESVAAVIEVKTWLRTKSIRDASRNISDARRLRKTGGSTDVGTGSIKFGPPTPVLGVLFAYGLDVSLETFRRSWSEAQSALPPGERTNLVCVLGETVVVQVDRAYHLWDEISGELDGSFVAIDSGKDSLLVFTLLLMRALAEHRFGVPDLFKYVFIKGGKVQLRMVDFD